MRIIALAVMCATLAGCSEQAITSPSAASTTPGSTNAKPSAKGEQRVTIYFYTDTGIRGEHHKLTGLPVLVETESGSWELTPDRRGSVVVSIPAADDGMWVSTEAWGGYCALPETYIPLPYPSSYWLRLQQCSAVGD
jgi:hypothetical protein